MREAGSSHISFEFHKRHTGCIRAGLRGSRAGSEVALVTQGHGGRDAGDKDSGTTWRFRERWAWALGQMVRLEFEMRWGRGEGFRHLW